MSHHQCREHGIHLGLKVALLCFCLAAGLPAAESNNPAPEGAGSSKRQLNRAAADHLFTNATVLRLRLAISKDGMQSLRREPRKYVEATLWEGNASYERVGVHVKGAAGSFRPIDDKPGLTVNMTVMGGTNRFHGLKKFHLNNSAQDASCLSEYVCGEMFRQAGIPSARAGLAIVELNGRKLGVSVLLESMDKDFLAQYFPQSKGNLYGQRGNCDVIDAIERMEGEEPEDRADLKALAAAAREPDPARCWERLQNTLDVDRFVSFMALELMLGHWDGYCLNRNNFRIYHDPAANRMVFLPHDLDQLMQNASAPLWNPGLKGLVAQAVWKSPEIRFRERVGTLFTNVFVAPELTSRLDRRVAQVLPELTAYDPRLAQQLKSGAEALKNRVISRCRVLARQMEAPKRLQFEGQVAKLSGWRTELSQGNATFVTLKQGGAQSLSIRCENGGCVASWRMAVLLEPGRYRFSGRARCAGVVADEGGAGGGGGLRNHLSKRTNKLAGDREWTTLTHEFLVTPDKRDVMLVCDLRARQGQIWFDTDSLILENLR